MTLARMRRAGGAALAVWLATAAAASAQTLGQAPEAPVSWARWLGALGLCLGLGLAGALALRMRMGGGARLSLPLPHLATARTPRRLKVLEARRVSPSLEVCLISLDGHEYVLAATSQAVLQLRPGVAVPEERP